MRFRNLYICIRLELMHVKIIAASPAENKEAEEAQQKQEAGLGRFAAFNISGIVYYSAWLIL